MDETEEEEKFMTVPAAGKINGHLVVHRGMLDGGRECEVIVEVKASGSLSATSDSDQVLGFAESCIHMPAPTGLHETSFTA